MMRNKCSEASSLRLYAALEYPVENILIRVGNILSVATFHTCGSSYHSLFRQRMMEDATHEMRMDSLPPFVALK